MSTKRRSDHGFPANALPFHAPQEWIGHVDGRAGEFDFDGRTVRGTVIKNLTVVDYDTRQRVDSGEAIVSVRVERPYVWVRMGRGIGGLVYEWEPDVLGRNPYGPYWSGQGAPYTHLYVRSISKRVATKNTKRDTAKTKHRRPVAKSRVDATRRMLEGANKRSAKR